MVLRSPAPPQVRAQLPWASTTWRKATLPISKSFYDQDGYSGGSYVNCGDISQPGGPAVTNYLDERDVITIIPVAPVSRNWSYPAARPVSASFAIFSVVKGGGPVTLGF